MERKNVVLSDGDMARQREFTEKIKDLHIQRGKAVHALVDTFGCQQNVADSQHIMGMLEAMGCDFVTEPEGEPSAVLLRGLAPVHGLEAICRLRYGKAPDELTAYQRKNFLNGPGKCCQALGLDRRQNGIDLTTGEELFLCTALSDVGLPDQLPRPLTIHTGKRIGIDYAQEAVDFPWRFWIDDKGEYLC